MNSNSWNDLTTLPCEDGKYLVYYSCIDIIEVGFYSVAKSGFYDSSVTHWMSLPPPPAGSP